MSAPIFAIGGGGFLMDDASGLQERYLLSGLGPRPRVVYVGTAMGDSERHRLRFLELFLGLGCDATTLPFFPYQMHRDYAATVADADLVYVGGGNTVAMLAVWREFGFDAALRTAWEGGTALAGISAGANCWFEAYVTDSVPGGGIRPGLGWLPGTFCPHLDGEPWRAPVAAAAPVTPVFAAPDGVIVRFDAGRATEAVTSRAGLQAMTRTAGELAPMPTRLLAP